MSLLKDDQLDAKVNPPAPPAGAAITPIVTDVPPPPTLPAGALPPGPWFGKKSAIQPSSLDLHIGEIYIPETDSGKSGSVTNPKTDHVLNTGETVVVTSLEELHLPDDLAAVGFPPSEIAFRGLLMINPGHIDPGYNGRLRFTLINVGRNPISLERENPIFTVLFFQLKDNTGANASSICGYGNRHGAPGFTVGPPTQEDIDRLSPDFLDLNNRATKAASTAVLSASYRGPIWTAIISGIVVVITGLATGAFGFWSPLIKVQKDVDTLNKAVDIGEPVSRKISDMQKGIDELKKELQELQKSPTKGKNP